MNKILTITKYNLLNNLRNKAFHISFGFMILLSVFSIAIGEMAIYAQGRFILNFSLISIQIISIINAIILGTFFYKKDIEKNGFIHLIISKPVSKNQFIISYIISGSTTLLINILAMSAFSSILFIIQQISFNTNFFYSVIFMWFLSTTVLGFSIAFSSISGTFISFFSTISYTICGFMIRDIYLLSEKGKGLAKVSGTLFKYLIPDLMVFDLKNQAIYNSIISTETIIRTILYFIIWLIVLAIINCIIINNTDI